MDTDRPLLFSEQTVLRVHVASLPEHDLGRLRVKNEHYSKPRSKGRQWFNTDFMIQFFRNLPESTTSMPAVPIRQRSMGAELFFITAEDGTPARLELLAGEAFPKSYYKEEVGAIEEAIRRAGISEWPMGIHSAQFLRVFDFDSCVIFLASDRTDIRPFAFAGATKYVGNTYEIHTRITTDCGHLIEGVILSSRKKNHDGWVLSST